MSIVVDYSKILERAAPRAKIKRLLKRDLTLKKAALAFVDAINVVSKKEVTNVALKVLREYKKMDLSTSEKAELAKNPKLLIQRVQNDVVFQITEGIKDKYSGEKYRWLASDAEEPDPEHQLNYGKVFTVGEGEMPGERPGCRCGLEILVDGESLEI
jgi:hypothetical protein